MHYIISIDLLTEANYNLVLGAGLLILWKRGVKAESQGWEFFSSGFRWKAHLWNCGSVFLLLPLWMLHFTCAEDGAVLAQLFADAPNGDIRCWTHPQSHSLCNHIRPGQCTTDPVSCETERWSLFDSGRNPKRKIHFWFNRDVSRRANGDLLCFWGGSCCKSPFKSSWGPSFPCSCSGTGL